MDDRTSTYQSLKLLLAGYLPVDRDILHVLIGVALVLGAVFYSRKSKQTGPFVWALAIAVALGFAMEAVDMKDDIQSLGNWRWRASVLDFIRTIIAPLIVVILISVFKGRLSKTR